MRAIDADALQLAIVEEGQANKRKKYIIGDIWELTGAEIRDVINSQPTIQSESQWISVTERLPEENYLDDGYVEPSQYVLAYMSYHVCKVSRYWGHRKTKGTSDYVIPDWMDLEEHDGDNVLAWMPLPEPYKGVAE